MYPRIFQPFLAIIREQRNETETMCDEFVGQGTAVLQELDLIDACRGGGGELRERRTRQIRLAHLSLTDRRHVGHDGSS